MREQLRWMRESPDKRGRNDLTEFVDRFMAIDPGYAIETIEVFIKEFETFDVSKEVFTDIEPYLEYRARAGLV